MEGERAAEATSPPPASPGAAPEDRGASSAPGTAAGSERDVAVLVVEESGSALRVIAANRAAAADMGAARAWNGTGRATHRWVLRGPAGEELTSGPIAARRDVHLPPDPRAGVDAVHVHAQATSFIVRAAWPAAGEIIEIAALAQGDAPLTQGTAAPAVVRWQP